MPPFVFRFAAQFFVLLTVVLGMVGCAAYGPPRRGEVIVRHIAYTRADNGRELHLDLYRPKSTEPLPVVVWFHGGAWVGGHNGYHLLVRDLSRYGFAVASVDYRLLRRRNPWPDQLNDCFAAVDWVQSHGLQYGLDSRHMGVSGESAGGHLAAMVALEKKKPTIRAACLMYPPTDLVTLARRYAGFRRLSIFELMFHGNIDSKIEAAREASPVAKVNRDAPPFLIFHGDRDVVVPVEQSRELDAALKKAGVDSKLVVVRGQDHAFKLTQAQLAQVAAFFQKEL